jgi:hypothetical protein
VEIIEEWCGECGMRIPEVLLKEARPKPHLRHPHPLPSLPVETPAEDRQEIAMRLAGLLLLLGGIAIGLASLGWGIYRKFSTGEMSLPAMVGGGVAVVTFVAGVVLMTRNEARES